MPSLSASSLVKVSLAAFLASARSTVPSLSVSNRATGDGFLAKAACVAPMPASPAMADNIALRREIMGNPRNHSSYVEH